MSSITTYQKQILAYLHATLLNHCKDCKTATISHRAAVGKFVNIITNRIVKRIVFLLVITARGIVLLIMTKNVNCTKEKKSGSIANVTMNIL